MHIAHDCSSSTCAMQYQQFIVCRDGHCLYPFGSSQTRCCLANHLVWLDPNGYRARPSVFILKQLNAAECEGLACKTNTDQWNDYHNHAAHALRVNESVKHYHA